MIERMLEPEFETEVGGWLGVNGVWCQILRADLDGGFVTLTITNGVETYPLRLRPSSIDLYPEQPSSILVIRNPDLV